MRLDYLLFQTFVIIVVVSLVLAFFSSILKIALLCFYTINGIFCQLVRKKVKIHKGIPSISLARSLADWREGS